MATGRKTAFSLELQFRILNPAALVGFLRFAILVMYRLKLLMKAQR